MLHRVARFWRAAKKSQLLWVLWFLIQYPEYSRIMCSLLFNVVLTLENQARLKMVGAGRVAECTRGVDGGLAAGSIFAAHLGHRCPW